jgi:hypothetical protein
VTPQELAFVAAASTARLSAVMLTLLAEVPPEQLDAVKASGWRHDHFGMLQQRHAPWLSKTWPLDPVESDLAADCTRHSRRRRTAVQYALSAIKIKQQLLQRFPGLKS